MSETGKGRRFLKGLGCVLLLVLTASLGAAAVVGSKVRDFLATPPTADGDVVAVEIAQGASGRAVADQLHAQGVVTDADHFYLLLRYREAGPGIRAGEFEFRTDWTPDEVIDALHNAPERTYPLGLPEGLRYLEIAPRVEAAGLGWSGERFLELVRDPEVRQRAGVEADDLEGYLFPETYRFSRHATEEDVVEAMLAQFEAHFGPEEEARAAELGLSRHEIVILASLVEKETGVPDERPLVASVFHNRLRIGMKMECDPTIIYGIENYDGIIHRSDIRNPHLWNTYVHPGLPKGPIANPGGGALHAALYPADTKYLYFVAKNDGSHHFSESYAEHARMVNRYQR